MNFILGLFHWHKIKIWLQLFYWSSLIKIIGSPYIHIYIHITSILCILGIKIIFFKRIKSYKANKYFQYFYILHSEALNCAQW